MRFSIGCIRVYPWHSVNIIPQIGCIPICENEAPYDWDHTMIEVVILGYVIHVDVPWKLPSMGTRLIGPIWSKRKKKWH